MRDAGRHDGWTTYLSVVTVGVICFGAALVLAPDVGSALFGTLVYGRSGFPAEFTDEALAYVQLSHAVIGAMMVGWFGLALWVVRGPLAAGHPGAWKALALTLATWFLLDTSFSLLTGFTPNAALNVVFLVACLPGLVGTRRGRTVVGARSGARRPRSSASA